MSTITAPESYPTVVRNKLGLKPLRREIDGHSQFVTKSTNNATARRAHAYRQCPIGWLSRPPCSLSLAHDLRPALTISDTHSKLPRPMSGPNTNNFASVLEKNKSSVTTNTVQGFQKKEPPSRRRQVKLSIRVSRFNTQPPGCPKTDVKQALAGHLFCWPNDLNPILPQPSLYIHQH